MLKNCPMRHPNGICLPVGGFCPDAVSGPICEVVQRAYEMGIDAGLIQAQKRTSAENEPTQHSTWISVKDGFPDTSGRFLVYEPGFGVYEALTTLQNGRYFWYKDSLTPRNGVTHWMNLPEPPKEGLDEREEET